jgi:hypothetical protein
MCRTRAILAVIAARRRCIPEPVVIQGAQDEGRQQHEAVKSSHDHRRRLPRLPYSPDKHTVKMSAFKVSHLAPEGRTAAHFYKPHEQRRQNLIVSRTPYLQCHTSIFSVMFSTSYRCKLDGYCVKISVLEDMASMTSSSAKSRGLKPLPSEPRRPLCHRDGQADTYADPERTKAVRPLSTLSPARDAWWRRQIRDDSHHRVVQRLPPSGRAGHGRTGAAPRRR